MLCCCCLHIGPSVAVVQLWRRFDSGTRVLATLALSCARAAVLVHSSQPVGHGARLICRAQTCGSLRIHPPRVASMVLARCALACWACLVGATPVVNVVVEPPLGGLDSSSGSSKLQTALLDLQALARSVRDGTDSVRIRAAGALQAQQGATSFVQLSGARSDAARLASLLADVASSVGSATDETLPDASGDVPAAEVEVRKRLLEAREKFSEAAAGATAAATSFLQPVDANRLRGSLRATEPMRTAPPLAVNVVMAEDIAGMA